MNFTMRSAVLCAFTLAAAGTLHAEDEPSADRLLKKWAAAWQAGDVDKMMDFYDSSKETTAVESLGNIRKGPAEIRKMYQEAFEEVTFERVTVTPIAKGQTDSVAWATCRFVAKTKLKSSGDRYVLEVLGTFVMKKDEKGWKIALEHFSTIPDVPRVRPADE